ncbi:MAG: hypothetical protein OCD01_01260 [Fibrobacterales bacterium]
MDPIQSNAPGGGVQPQTSGVTSYKKVVEQGVSDESEVKERYSQEAVINDISSVSTQIAEQNQKAMQSAGHLTGLDMLGSSMNVAVQGTMISDTLDLI